MLQSFNYIYASFYRLDPILHVTTTEFLFRKVVNHFANVLAHILENIAKISVSIHNFYLCSSIVCCHWGGGGGGGGALESRPIVSLCQNGTSAHDAPN